MSFRIRALALALALAGAGCDSGAHTHAPAPHDEHAHAAQPSELRTNAGAKWVMDAHTRAEVGKLRAAAADAAPATPEEVRALGADLQQHLRDLIAGCTMSGEAHDQLHVFLGRFMPLVEAFAQEADVEQARGKLQEIRAALAEYDRVFE